MKNGTSTSARADVAPPQAAVFEFAGYRCEPDRRALTRSDGAAVKLSNKSFDALLYFLEHAGTLVDRDELLRALWPKRVVEANNLNQAITGLRRALGERHIVTVAGRGYQWVTPVARELRPPSVATPAVAAPPSEPPVAPSPPAVPATRGHAAPRRSLFVALGVVAAAASLTAAVLLGPWQTRSPPTLGALASITPLTSYVGEETTPALSPDGTRVAFSWEAKSGQRAIYWLGVASSTPIRLSFGSAGADVFPAWSPDGEQIAFVRRYDVARFDVVTVPALGGPEHTLYSGEMYWTSVEGFPLLAWTPDSAQLLFTTRVADTEPSAYRYALHRLTLATGVIEALPSAYDTFYDTSPAFSPDGAWLAFTRFQRGERLNRLMVQPLGKGFAPQGEPYAVPGLDQGLYASTYWGPASDRLYFVNGGKILEWPIGGPVRTVYTAAPLLSNPMMSMARHGRGMRAAIVAEQANLEIFALPLDPKTHERIGEPSARVPSSGVDYHPRLSPDGTRLAFVSGRNKGIRALWLADADGHNERQLTAVGELITGYPRWSPDSKIIAFHTSARNEERVIHAVDVESGRTERLFNGCCPGGWSADGRFLYVTDVASTPYNIERVNVSDGSRETLFEGETASESADGRYLLYSKTREPGYFRRSLAGVPSDNPEERLVEDYRPTLGGLAPVADGFFYIGMTPTGEPHAIRFLDYALGASRDVAPVPSNTAIGLTVSPDGREVLYAASARPEADIMLYEFADEEPD